MSESQVPKHTWSDDAITVLKIGASAIPVAGGPIVEAINFVDIRWLSGKRMRDFCEAINERPKRIEGLTPEHLGQNDVFVSTLLHAIQAATRSHQKEKLEALRNAVLNSALSAGPDEDMQLIFIYLVDSLTSWHLRLILACEDTWGWKAEKKQESSDLPNPYVVGSCLLIEALFPALKGKHDFYDHLLKDLVNRGLIAISERQMSLKTLVYRTLVLTPMGREFRKFITSHIENNLGTKDQKM